MTEWLDALDPDDSPLLLGRCVEWKRHKPRRPIRGRLRHRWLEIVRRRLPLAEDWLWHQDDVVKWELDRQTCIKRVGGLSKGNLFDGATMEWGMADFPRQMTIGDPTDD